MAMPPWITTPGPKFTMREAFLTIHRMLSVVHPSGEACPCCGRAVAEASLLAKMASELLAIIEREILDAPPAILVPKDGSFKLYLEIDKVRPILANVLHLQSVKHLLGDK
jgi:hypothetical protein